MGDPLSKIIESSAAKSAESFLSRIAGSAADLVNHSNAFINFRLRALENQIDALKRVEEICKEKKINVKQVKLNVLLPYLEGVAVEEEPEMQRLWANLMVNYVDANKNMTNHVFPHILKQLSTEDVKLLQSMGSSDKKHDYWATMFITYANLERLGLVEFEKDFRIDTQGWAGERPEIVEGTKSRFVISMFGHLFLSAFDEDEDFAQ